jgi:membrane protease YdiL (CAAX protease family)
MHPAPLMTARRVAAITLTGLIAFQVLPDFWYDAGRPLWRFIPVEYRGIGSYALLGLALTIWSPSAFGLRLAHTWRRRRFVLAVTLIALVPMAVGMLFIRNPFYGGSPSFYLLTPLAEELLFRGFCHAVLADAFPQRLYVNRVAVSAAALLSGLAFGLWHLGGLRLPPTDFIWLQLGYTTVGGVLMGILRDRTGSIWPAWAIHVAVNIMAVHLPGFWSRP